MALDDDHCANALDIGDHEAQWLTLFTGLADHPKRRHIDLNEEPKLLNHVKLLQLNCRIVVQDIFYNPAKDTNWDLEQLKLQDEKFDGQR
ncbi:TMV resistance protein N-like [Prunus yedoensis var. nudiflora]|uniref:TMV resistance protein N-like n=1 Tax=Prunus yedoensis var. nudiflora TaxID=2094558 RepID=A0A314ZKZ1_PRUYE|nr:TMV resistance protein N-like [Prunus yedoensis var. nudiflora]